MIFWKGNKVSSEQGSAGCSEKEVATAGIMHPAVGLGFHIFAAGLM